MAYFLAPNWNSDEAYFVVGPRSLLMDVIGDRRKFDKGTLFLARILAVFGAITVGLCVMLAATTDLPGLLGFIVLVSISLIGSHPRFSKDVEPLTCNLTFARRRSAYTLAYIMYGTPQQLGWWHGAFPSTDRQSAWQRNMHAWINGVEPPIDFKTDDMGDLFSVQKALSVLDKLEFKAVRTESQAGVDQARNANLDFLLNQHSKHRTAYECLVDKFCFCREEQGLIEERLAEQQKRTAEQERRLAELVDPSKPKADKAPFSLITEP